MNSSKEEIDERKKIILFKNTLLGSQYKDYIIKWILISNKYLILNGKKEEYSFIGLLLKNNIEVDNIDFSKNNNKLNYILGDKIYMMSFGRNYAIYSIKYKY